ncbi:Mitochondrial 5'-3' exonuclease and sliding exonuclease [Blastocladiella emersonii ATCC 22665]|nr:Mitochondrial 5'-3' exonuclease and sliding exonuclease [Blastocladiella emersonii ATCC 22665]
MPTATEIPATSTRAPARVTPLLRTPLPIFGPKSSSRRLAKSRSLPDTTSAPRPPRKPATPYLKVTDITGAQWCEIQWLFTRTYTRSRLALELLGCAVNERAEAAMATGTAVHAKIELELHQPVVVERSTFEDDLALRVLRVLFSVGELLVHGITREMPVRGLVTHEATGTKVWVVGIIDEIERRDNPDTGEVELVLVDHKTRATASLPPRDAPGPALAVTQLGMYRRLLSGMLAGEWSPPTVLTALARGRPFAATRPLSRSVIDYIAASRTMSALCPGFDDAVAPGAAGAGVSLYDVAGWTHVALQLIFGPPLRISPRVEISYVYAGRRGSRSRKVTRLGTLAYDVDEAAVAAQLQATLDVAFGTRRARGVEDIEEAGRRCAECEFSPICAFRHARETALVNQQMAAARERQERARNMCGLVLPHG